MEVFILDSFERLKTEIIDNQQIDIDEPGELPFITVCCPGRVELRKHSVG